MPPTVEDRLKDISESIAEIQKLLAGMDFQTFSTDRLLGLATNINIVWDITQNHLPSLKSFVDQRIKASKR